MGKKNFLTFNIQCCLKPVSAKCPTDQFLAMYPVLWFY